MADTSNRQSADMRRAKNAYDKVIAIKGRDKADRKKYASRAKDVGALIMTAGLGSTLAFLRAKDKMSQELYRHLSTWVVKALQESDGRDLHMAVMEEDTSYYRRATTEAIAYATWLKRWVEGEFGDELLEASGE